MNCLYGKINGNRTINVTTTDKIDGNGNIDVVPIDRINRDWTIDNTTTGMIIENRHVELNVDRDMTIHFLQLLIRMHCRDKALPCLYRVPGTNRRSGKSMNQFGPHSKKPGINNLQI